MLNLFDTFDTPDLGEIDLAQPLDDHELNVGRQAWWLTLPGRYGGTTWFDLVGGYPAVLNGFSSGYGWNPFSYPGGAGSLKFDGSTTYLTATKYPKPTAGISVGLSFCRTGSADCFLLDTDDDLTTAGLSLQFYTTHFYVTLAPAAYNNNFAWSPTLNTWYRLWATYNGSTLSVYANNVLKFSTAVSGSLSWTSNPLNIGRRSSNSTYFPGYLNDLTIYGRGLSAAEVAADWALQQQGYAGVLRRRPRVSSQTAGTRPSATPPIAAFARRAAILGTGIV